MKLVALLLPLSLFFNFAMADSLPVSPVEADIKFKGSFDKEAVRRAILDAKSRFQKCKSEKPLRFSIEFQIRSDGRAKASMSNGYPLPEDKAMDCIFSIFNSIKFPKGNNESTDSVEVPMVVGSPPKIEKPACLPGELHKNFESACMSLNGLHLRSLGIPHMQNDFRVVCKCVIENFDLKKLIHGNSCDFKTDDAFALLKTRPVYVMCVQGR